MPLQSLRLVGMSHQTAPLELRGKFALDPSAVEAVYGSLRSNGVEEAIAISTCNRTEFYVVAESESAVFQAINLHRKEVDSSFFSHLYRKSDADAALHLFRVTSGLDSKVLGENEIQGQIRRAWKHAKQCGMVGPKLDRLLNEAIRTGKHVRTHTQLGQHVVSVGSLAVREALGGEPDFSDKTVAIVGSGDMAQRVLKELKRLPVGRLVIYSRDPQRVRHLAKEYHADAIHTSELRSQLAGLEVIFLATHAQNPLISSEAVLDRDSRKPLRIIDLSVPSAVDPAVVKLEGVSVVNVDQLAEQAYGNHKLRLAQVAQADELVENDFRSYLRSVGERPAIQVISALHQRADSIKREQLDWALSKLGHLDDSQQKALEIFASRLVDRILHQPVTEMRSLAGDAEALSTAARLFGVSAS